MKTNPTLRSLARAVRKELKEQAPRMYVEAFDQVRLLGRRLDPILLAAGQPMIGNHKLVSIDADKEYLTLTIMTARRNPGEIVSKLPLKLLDDPEPVDAARRLRLVAAVDQAKTKFDEATAALIKAQHDLYFHDYPNPIVTKEDTSCL